MTKEEREILLQRMLDRSDIAAHRDIFRERIHQIHKHGDTPHEPFKFLSILIEEVGEFAQALNDHHFGGPNAHKLRYEAVQAAAVGMALVEAIDRLGLGQNPDQMELAEVGS